MRAVLVGAAVCAVAFAGCLENADEGAGDLIGEPARIEVGWHEKAPGLTARNEVAMGQIGSTFYAIGGNNPDWGAGSRWVEAYDAATDAWTRLANFSFPIHHTAVVGVDPYVYVLGGFDTGSTPHADTWRYDPATDAWERMADMPLPRAAHAAAAVDDQIVVVGGYASIGLHVLPVAVYDIPSDSWTLGAPIPTPRDHLAAAAAGDKVYAVAGDRAGHGVNADAMEAYDVTTGLWESLAPLPRTRGSLGATNLDGLIMVAGGQDGARTYGEVDVYDPASNSWSTMPDLQQPRHGFGFAAWDGYLYAILGGPEPGRTSTTSVEAYGEYAVTDDSV